MITLRKKQPTVTAEKALHIVIADDVHEIVELVRGWLEEAGHTVTCAANGRDVMRLLREKSFDVLITDIVMPEGDGWDAILAVNRLRPATRILAISGGGRNMPADACLRVAKGVGADQILKKPFNRAQLIAALHQVSPR
ncbi:MAG: response regulator [Opitutaceae bacterium]|nr:response regulator [Opitutaceae bacterium]